MYYLGRLGIVYYFFIINNEIDTRNDKYYLYTYILKVFKSV